MNSNSGHDDMCLSNITSRSLTDLRRYNETAVTWV